MRPSSFMASLFSLFLVLCMLAFSLLNGFFHFGNTVLNTFFEEFIVFGIPTVLFFALTKSSPKDIFSVKPLSIKNAGIIFLLSIALQPALMAVSAVTSIFFKNPATDFLNDMASAPPLTAVLIVAVMPAFFEELFFRGLIFSNYRHVEIKKACLMTGLFFGLAHMDLQQFAYAFIMGIIFCYFVYRTGSIFSSMLSHFTINLSQALFSAYLLKAASRVSQSQASQAAADAGTFQVFLSFAVIVLLSLIVVYLLFRLFEKNNAPLYKNMSTENIIYCDNSFKSEKIIRWPLFVLLIVYILYTI